MRRNDVVLLICDGGWSFYGRIVRVIDETHAEVIDCGSYCRILSKDDFQIVNEYKGYWIYRDPSKGKAKVFNRMPTLRRLKQMRARYDKTVWKRYRKL